MSGLNLPFPLALPFAAPTSPLLEVDIDTATVKWQNVQDRPYAFSWEFLNGIVTVNGTVIGKHTFATDCNFVADFVDQLFGNVTVAGRPTGAVLITIQDQDDNPIGTIGVSTGGVITQDTEGGLAIAALQGETFVFTMDADATFTNFDVTFIGTIPNT